MSVSVVNKVKIEPKYRRSLNDDQVKVLQLLYNFRFAGSGHIAMFFNKPSSKHIQKRLKILEDQEFVAKRYDKTYKLKGKPAAYCLTPKGARLLKTKTDRHVDDKVVKSLYKNKAVSEEFIAHCLRVFSVYLHFGTLYSGRLPFSTRSQLVPHTYFPGWTPDAYLQLSPQAGGTTKDRFFLDIFDDTRPFFVSVRKARNYIKYSEEGGWESKTNTDLPTVLIICAGQRNEKKLRRQIRKALNESYEQVTYATTTLELFMKSARDMGSVWRLTNEEDEIHTLDSLSADTG